MKCFVFCLVVLTALFGVVGLVNASPINVLLLGDGGSETQVQPALEDAGYTVVFGGNYYDWDGITPNVNNFDVAIYLDGYDYGYGLQTDADQALATFVSNGGGLIFTEWAAYDLYYGDLGDKVGQLMPVTAPDADYGDGDTWTVLDATHPLVAGLPASWYDDAGFSYVDADPNATVVIAGTGNNPLLTYRTDVGGRVVHINHDMTYTTDTINENALQIVVNAVEFVTIPEPSTLLLLGSGLLGIALRKKRRK